MWKKYDERETSEGDATKTQVTARRGEGTNNSNNNSNNLCRVGETIERQSSKA